ncbi:Protein lap1 [Diplonema papillatum]|nr:Protein lap1 [Diplonema papillatum]
MKKGKGDPKDKFWASVMNQKMDTLRWSLSNCNGLEASTQNEEGLTALMMAARGDKWKSMQMLLDFYARNNVLREHGWVECTDEEGKTALMMAAEVGSVKCVDFLLDAQCQGRGERNKGVNDTSLGETQLKQKDSKGKTALDHAKLNRKENVVALIQEFLAPPEEVSAEAQGRDAEGMSATQRNKQKKRALIEQSGCDAMKKHAEEEEKRLQREKDEMAAELAAAKIANRKPIWPEVAKVDATADKSAKICEINVTRLEKGPDCPVHGDDANPVDPALWDLVMITRLQLRLPPGLLKIPPSIKRLQMLQILILSHNALPALPDAVCELVSLKVLEVEDNLLTALPKNLGKLPKLEVIKAGRNKLTTLAPLQPLKQLTIIQAESNALTSFDGLDLENSTRLSEIALQNNQIDEIPDEISGCTVLSRLALSDNKITEVPSSITQLKKVKDLILDGNPLADNKVKKYLEAGGKGLKDLWKYLEKNAKKSGGKKKNKKKKAAAESDDEEDDD